MVPDGGRQDGAVCPLGEYDAGAHGRRGGEDRGQPDRDGEPKAAVEIKAQERRADSDPRGGEDARLPVQYARGGSSLAPVGLPSVTEPPQGRREVDDCGEADGERAEHY